MGGLASQDVMRFRDALGNVYREHAPLRPYTIALSKLARGLESDIQDVLFLLREGTIEMEERSRIVDQAIPLAWRRDVDPVYGAISPKFSGFFTSNLIPPGPNPPGWDG